MGARTLTLGEGFDPMPRFTKRAAIVVALAALGASLSAIGGAPAATG